MRPESSWPSRYGFGPSLQPGQRLIFPWGYQGEGPLDSVLEFVIRTGDQPPSQTEVGGSDAAYCCTPYPNLPLCCTK